MQSSILLLISTTTHLEEKKVGYRNTNIKSLLSTVQLICNNKIIGTHNSEKLDKWFSKDNKNHVVGYKGGFVLNLSLLYRLRKISQAT